MSSLVQYRYTHSSDRLDIRGAILLRHAELPTSALALLVILGTTATLWNIRNCAFNGRGELGSDIYKGKTVLVALRAYASSVQKMVKRIATLNHGLQDLVSLHEDTKDSKEPDTGSRGRAHLGYQYFSLSPPGTQNLTRWNLDRRVQSYVEGKVAYNEGCLVVEQSGYYYIYSQVSFVKALRDWTANQSVVFHELMRLSDASNKSETLLRAQKTYSWDKQLRCSLDASYLGATFFLQKGDRIFVAVSDTNFIWQTPRRTYFGMQSL